jgi:hypothetical protein
MDRRFICFLIASCGFFGDVGLSFASDGLDPQTLGSGDVPDTAPTLAIQPRTWLTSISDKRFGMGAVESSESAFMPLGGATIRWIPQGLNAILELTTLYGHSSGVPYDDVDLASSDIFQGKIELNRLDIEALAHKPFGSGVATANFGLRYIN